MWNWKKRKNKKNDFFARPNYIPDNSYTVFTYQSSQIQTARWKKPVRLSSNENELEIF